MVDADTVRIAERHARVSENSLQGLKSMLGDHIICCTHGLEIRGQRLEVRVEV